MTVIAACVDEDGSVWMGADRISVSRNDNVRLSSQSKIFRLGEMLIGSSGTMRTHQIAQFGLSTIAIPDARDLREWLVKDFVEILRSAMKANGGECRNRDGDPEMDGRLLIGVRGTLCTIDSGYGVCDLRTPYGAVGCADQEALAGMFVARKLVPSMHARAVVECGLEAAAEFDLNIRPPFEIFCDTEENVAGLRAVG